MSVHDRAGRWLEEMADNGMPGDDFLVQAPNVAMSAWLPRPAEYRGFSRAFQTLLMTYGGETPASVITYTPHGCRHVQVTAGTQLAAQGLMTDAALECIGHWEKGSKMPRHYDSEACVTELQTRRTVTSAYRSGWRPATDGCMPTPATPAMSMSAAPMTPAAMTPIRPVAFPHEVASKVVAPSGSVIGASKSSSALSSGATRVFNKQRNKFHMVVPPSVKSRCNFWTCGDRDRPAANADFEYNGPGTKCTKCFFR